ncbi:MAG: VOC family protein [Actinobacteria bacterium]|nr:VOC family protein [Actinomycetota bacterium]
MTTFDFGQPDDGVIQMAYIVPDIDEAMRAWSDNLKVGPWFLLDSFTGVDPVYRGNPSQADVKLAMGFAGHMQIELIQPKDEHPSVYREVRDTRGWGFHHYGRATRTFEADLQHYEAKGYELAFLCGVPTGGSVGYLDTKGELPGMLELIEVGPAMEPLFTKFYLASVGWDGSDPVRPFG